MRISTFIAALTLLACRAFADAPYPTFPVTPVSGVNYPAPPKPVKPTIAVTTGPHWSHPRTIADHLRLDHGVDPSGMSREEMLSLHDALHEGRATRSQVRQFTAGGCPGNNCPLNSRRRR